MSAALFSGETRVVLTEQCNYRCIFCHNEGVGNAGSSSEMPDVNRLCRAMDEMITNGCRDITFTGGEPLIHDSQLFSLIRYIRARDNLLPVTVVTNGSLLTPEMIRDFAAAGYVQLNISFHTADNPEYMRLTGQTRFSLDALGVRLRQLRDAGLPFKMNGVALRSSLPDKAAVAGLIEFAQQSGAVSLKLSELLIVEQHRHLLGEHLSLESVEKRLPSSFEFQETGNRGRLFRDRSSGFIVELRKCRCHFGCEECLRTQRTASLDGRGRHWACFARPGDRNDLAVEGYEQTMKLGEELLEGMLKQHGTGSPSLDRQVEM